MKIRPIPETDLACFTVLPDNEQRSLLLKFGRGRAPYSYKPSRDRWDTLNIQVEGSGAVQRAPWPEIADAIRHHCLRLRFKHPEKGIASNLSVSEGLYNFATKHGVRGVYRPFDPLFVGNLAKLVFWSPVVLTIDDALVIPFFDFRRKERMNQDGMRFAYSVMHHRIRAEFRNLAHARLAIVQFSDNQDGPRTPLIHYGDEVELYTDIEVMKMTENTYGIWREVREKILRENSIPKVGYIGPLFDRAV